MVRRYCDVCKDEMTNTNTPAGGVNGGRVFACVTTNLNGRKLGVEVLHTLDGVSNAGDVCKYCILDALLRLDDRPKEAPKEARTVGAVGQR